jgi:AcrR family transcriptional regulator
MGTPSTPGHRAGRIGRAERALATRQHLITTTIDVVRSKSYGAASLFEVAKAAGVTPGALQHHFGSRAVLMLEVLRTILEAEDDAGPAWPDAAVPLPERASRYVQALWTRVYEPPRFLAAWSVYFGAADEATLQPRIAEMRAELALSIRQRFVLVFPQAQARPDLLAFVDLVLSALRGMGVARLFGSDTAAEAAQRQQLAGVITHWCAAAAVAAAAADKPLPRSSAPHRAARATSPTRRKESR